MSELGVVGSEGVDWTDRVRPSGLGMGAVVAVDRGLGDWKVSC